MIAVLSGGVIEAAYGQDHTILERIAGGLNEHPE
jgi:hypothetical protein